jgi:prepilin-type N-terminal cleavage/methylation domain-containing protein
MTGGVQVASSRVRVRGGHPSGRAGGFTLVEVLVAVSIMGIAMTGIFQALSTFLNAGTVERSVANVDLVVRTYSERAIAAPYVNCASAYSAVILPSGYSFLAGPTIDYWNGDSPTTFSATCASDKGVQRITATVREQSSRQAQLLVVTKNSG